MSAIPPENSARENPFSLLGLALNFEVDESVIERAFLKRMAQIHPDRLAAEEGEESVAALSAAKSTLLNPEKRANLLLSLLGGPSSGDDKSLPAGFLANMMETRREIEEDLASGPQSREKWTRWAQQQRNEYVADLGPLFAHAGDGDSEAKTRIRRELNAWRYIERLIEQLDPRYDPNRADF